MDRLTRSSLREIRSHGDESFPLVAYWISRGPGEAVLDCHWHEEAEFFCVLEGETLFQVDGEYIPVRAGEAVYIDGGDIHAGHAMGDSSCSFCAIVFDPRFLASFGDDAIQKLHVTPLQNRTRTFPRHIVPDSDWERSILSSLLGVISACSGQRNGYMSAVKGYFYLMLHEITPAGCYADRSTGRSADPKAERLKKVILHMQAHYSRPISIRELASLIPMSEGQFCRFFKAMTRQTPVEYLNAYRINRANELLRFTDRKIADIAMEVGFGHISYFIKVYRKVMKTTPSRFRLSL